MPTNKKPDILPIFLFFSLQETKNNPYQKSLRKIQGRHSIENDMYVLLYQGGLREDVIFSFKTISPNNIFTQKKIRVL